MYNTYLTLTVNEATFTNEQTTVGYERKDFFFITEGAPPFISSATWEEWL